MSAIKFFCSLRKEITASELILIQYIFQFISEHSLVCLFNFQVILADRKVTLLSSSQLATFYLSYHLKLDAFHKYLA